MSQPVSQERVIRVRCVGEDEPNKFQVAVKDWSGETQYQVTMSQADFVRLRGDGATAEECIRAAFLFLLDREPRESILRRFDISVIERHFPEFFREFGPYRNSAQAG